MHVNHRPSASAETGGRHCVVQRLRSLVLCFQAITAAGGISRRDVLQGAAVAAGVPAALATLLGAPRPAAAAYGDSANVFGRVTNKSGFVPYVGDGFGVLLPAKWNPSPEREFDGMVLR
jgi:hypothetical protein